ncbi:hypothetical protein PMm318_A50890 [Pseudomonas moorei]
MGAAPDLVVQSIADMKACYPLLHLRIMGDTSDQLSNIARATKNRRGGGTAIQH